MCRSRDNPKSIKCINKSNSEMIEFFSIELSDNHNKYIDDNSLNYTE